MDWLVSPDVVMPLVGQIMQQQVTQFGIAFSLAAWIHSGRVKKEIASQLNGIRTAVNDLAAALRQDLVAQSERISKIETRVSRIESKPKKTSDENQTQ